MTSFCSLFSSASGGAGGECGAHLGVHDRSLALELRLHLLDSAENPLGSGRHNRLRNRSTELDLKEVRHLADRRHESLEMVEATRCGTGGLGGGGVASDYLVGLGHALGGRMLYRHV